MDKEEAVAQYEATGREEVFREAKRLYEQALIEAPADAEIYIKYGYLLECHARNQLRQAVTQYERAIELNPSGSKAHYQLIGARAGLLEPEIPSQFTSCGWQLLHMISTPIACWPAPTWRGTSTTMPNE